MCTVAQGVKKNKPHFRKLHNISQNTTMVQKIQQHLRKQQSVSKDTKHLTKHNNVIIMAFSEMFFFFLRRCCVLTLRATVNTTISYKTQKKYYKTQKTIQKTQLCLYIDIFWNVVFFVWCCLVLTLGATVRTCPYPAARKTRQKSEDL